MPIIIQTFYPISILVKRNQYLKTGYKQRTEAEKAQQRQSKYSDISISILFMQKEN